MRSFLWGISLAMLPFATAVAQRVENADKPAGAAPAAAKAGDARGPADRGPANRGAAPLPNAMFAAIDADGDGVITKLELRKAIKALRTLDADDDGNITLAEASAGGGPVAGTAPGQLGPFGPNAAGRAPDASTLIARYDLNGDNILSVNEAPQGMGQMFRPADDLNKNGAIDPGELEAMLARMGGDARPWAAGAEPGAQRNTFRDPNRRRPPRDENKN